MTSLPRPCPSIHPTFSTRGSLESSLAQDSKSRVQRAPCTQWGLASGALKGVESKGFDFDYPAKVHFLYIMTGWYILEITASLVPSPLSLVSTGAVSYWKAHPLKRGMVCNSRDPVPVYPDSGGSGSVTGLGSLNSSKIFLVPQHVQQS